MQKAILAGITPETGMIYVAGPYTHGEADVRERRFLDATIVAARLIEMGFIVYSPLSMTHPIDLQIAKDKGTMGSDYWVKFDEAFMVHCAAIVVLKSEGWGESNGVRREVAYFENTGKPVIYVEPDDFDISTKL